MPLQKSSEMPPGAIEVFGGQGFIARLDDNCAGDDLTVVNAARVSFGKKSVEISDGDIKMLNYLAENKHMSPFRHPQISFHLKAPEMMMRQAYKHVVGIDWTSGSPPIKDHAWNEISGRYVMYDDVYEPVTFRPQSETNKQGSEDGDLSGHRIQAENYAVLAGILSNTEDFGEVPRNVRGAYQECIAFCKATYQSLVDAGVSKEQARLVMPFSTFTEVIWTCSLESVLHFVKLRDHAHAQSEIREFAKAVADLTEEKFPHSFTALMNHL